MLQSTLPLHPGASVVIHTKLQAGKLNLELENVSNRCGPRNVGRIFKEGNNPSLVIHYARKIGTTTI